MSDAPRVVFRPTGFTPDQADSRARAWAFVFECHAKKEATHPGSPEDAERRSDEVGATEKYT